MRKILRFFFVTLGDDHNNERPGLRSLYTTFVRLHNRFAEMLGISSKHWADENISQEARKVLIAVAQRIAYK